MDCFAAFEECMEAKIYEPPAYVLFFAQSKDKPEEERYARYYGDYNADFNNLALEVVDMTQAKAQARLLQANKEAVKRAEEAVANSNNAVKELTDASWEAALQPVKEIVGQQVVFLFYGSLRSCKREQKILSDASKLLEGVERITLAQMNCDVHRRLCDLAGIASLCTFTVYNEGTMCPNQLGGTQGGNFGGRFKNAADIQSAMLAATGQKLPDAEEDWEDDDGVEAGGGMEQLSGGGGGEDPAEDEL